MWLSNVYKKVPFVSVTLFKTSDRDPTNTLKVSCCLFFTKGNLESYPKISLDRENVYFTTVNLAESLESNVNIKPRHIVHPKPPFAFESWDELSGFEIYWMMCADVA